MAQSTSTLPKTTPSETPIQASPRFEMELEFVSALANPEYLQFLSFHYPQLFQFINPLDSSNTSTSAQATTKKPKSSSNDNSDAAKFARYLKYLLYWKRPEYAQFLSHPAGTIRNLELLQNEQFRKDILHLDLGVRLAEGFTGQVDHVVPEEAPAPEVTVVEDGAEVAGDGDGGVNGSGNVAAAS
ncbi:Mediator of RNA polymerase II transcription subunit 31 [Lithohypha guttulata]|nr:Mediator of RNA polymerase II transcription subunit 31 [Lithohypha guttulata]